MGDMMRSEEERIFETEMVIRRILLDADLNVSVLELILRSLHLEIKALAKDNLEAKRKAMTMAEGEENGNISGV